MKSLNPTRYSVLLRRWFEEHTVLNPVQVNSVEPFILGGYGTVVVSTVYPDYSFDLEVFFKILPVTMFTS